MIKRLTKQVGSRHRLAQVSSKAASIYNDKFTANFSLLYMFKVDTLVKKGAGYKRSGIEKEWDQKGVGARKERGEGAKYKQE